MLLSIRVICPICNAHWSLMYVMCRVVEDVTQNMKN